MESWTLTIVTTVVTTEVTTEVKAEVTTEVKAEVKAGSCEIYSNKQSVWLIYFTINVTLMNVKKYTILHTDTNVPDTCVQKCQM